MNPRDQAIMLIAVMLAAMVSGCTSLKIDEPAVTVYVTVKQLIINK